MPSHEAQDGRSGQDNVGNAFADQPHVEDIAAGHWRRGEPPAPRSRLHEDELRAHVHPNRPKGGRLEGQRDRGVGRRRGVGDPTEPDKSPAYGVRFWKGGQTHARRALQHEPQDKGIAVETDKGRITAELDQERFRPAEAPTPGGHAEDTELCFRTTKTQRETSSATT
ncbi:GDP-D-mannose dehydratase [Thermoproteus tenax Kra 1]|uniref:GDP-D-mannose dehydratase n=1 Tax=Thermoproteus tenax (strain ATCC 35583 / DSM 2078 / JCM 9277 / NBRC 100435 / Kra 1) TaxID=768679 RepID=G4RKA9_THETK|nr:GDP-D-mannose dehydratase [Thermoproteus tenax Kra 1]